MSFRLLIATSRQNVELGTAGLTLGCAVVLYGLHSLSGSIAPLIASGVVTAYAVVFQLCLPQRLTITAFRNAGRIATWLGAGFAMFAVPVLAINTDVRIASIAGSLGFVFALGGIAAVTIWRTLQALKSALDAVPRVINAVEAWLTEVETVFLYVRSR